MRSLRQAPLRQSHQQERRSRRSSFSQPHQGTAMPQRSTPLQQQQQQQYTTVPPEDVIVKRAGGRELVYNVAPSMPDNTDTSMFSTYDSGNNRSGGGDGTPPVPPTLQF
mmetsp:Transcript_56190/g.138028  ORF Transcript_56190/g.138028 Transcript_56190/m.138028 type:complete len:109 (+) Transcript_56190:367-693(+)